MAEADLITLIFTAPYIYMVAIAMIIYFIFSKWTATKGRPEQKAFWGKEVRDNMTKKIFHKRNDVWGLKSKYTIIRSFMPIGKTIKIEPLYRNNPDKKEEDLEEFYIITFRQKGLWGWLKALIGKYETLLTDPKVLKIDDKHKHLIISPNAFLVEDSGIWTLSTKKESGLIDDLNLKVDIENIKGFSADFLRRLSNEHPNQAIYTERQEQEAGLKERERKSRVSSWVGK